MALPYRGLSLQEDPRLLCKEPLPLREEGLSPVVRLNEDGLGAQLSAIWEAIGLYCTARLLELIRHPPLVELSPPGSTLGSWGM